MSDHIYDIFVSSSEFPGIIEKNLSEKEIEYYCKTFLDKGEWIEAVILNNKSEKKISLDAEQTNGY